MAVELKGNEDVKARPRSLMPPFVVLRDFLDAATVAGLLDYALSRQSDFTATRLESNAVDPSIRVSTALRELGAYRQILKRKILELLPGLITQLRVTPFDGAKLETELVAHNDGAFYKRHIDTQTASDRQSIRVLSGVYYFHAEPKAFSGGALRLYAIGDFRESVFADVEPVRNTMLVFPSWAPHEVRPVSCPSRRFIDSRFAVNCWVYRRKAAAA
jgi:SM-20-related protein